MISWETKAARKIRKKVRSKALKNRNKSPKTDRISSLKESPDGNHVVTSDEAFLRFTG